MSDVTKPKVLTQYQRQTKEVKSDFRKTMYMLSDGVYGMFRYEPILAKETQEKYQKLLEAYREFERDMTKRELWD